MRITAIGIDADIGRRNLLKSIRQSRDMLPHGGRDIHQIIPTVESLDYLAPTIVGLGGVNMFAGNVPSSWAAAPAPSYGFTGSTVGTVSEPAAPARVVTDDDDDFFEIGAGGFALPAMGQMDFATTAFMEPAMAVELDTGFDPNVAVPSTNVRPDEQNAIKPYGSSLQIAWKQIRMPDFPEFGEWKKWRADAQQNIMTYVHRPDNLAILVICRPFALDITMEACSGDPALMATDPDDKLWILSLNQCMTNALRNMKNIPDKVKRTIDMMHGSYIERDDLTKRRSIHFTEILKIFAMSMPIDQYVNRDTAWEVRRCERR